jgi:hypothetical protein
MTGTPSLVILEIIFVDRISQLYYDTFLIKYMLYDPNKYLVALESS